MSGLLKGRRILIAGAAGGIGRETVTRFAAEGARLAVFDLAETAHDEAVAVFGGDVSDPDCCRAAVDGAAEALGGMDGMVNCAGIDLETPVSDMTARDWNRIIAVNLSGAMFLSRAVIGHLRAAGSGTIVNVSSAAGLSPLGHRAAYCASKAGLNMFGKCLAIELGPERIRVNTVCPGAVDTPLFRSSYEDYRDPEERLSSIKARYAMNRVADPAEIAGAILYLTGPDSSYVTGTTLAVDGGRTFH